MLLVKMLRWLLALLLCVYVGECARRCRYSADHVLCRRIVNLTLPSFAGSRVKHGMSIFDSTVLNPEDICPNLPAEIRKVHFRNASPIGILCNETIHCHKIIHQLIGCENYQEKPTAAQGIKLHGRPTSCQCCSCHKLVELDCVREL